MIALQLLSLSQSTISVPTEPPVRKLGPISPEEFQALATFVYDNPWTGSGTGSGRSGYIAHFEKFRQTVIVFLSLFVMLILTAVVSYRILSLYIARPGLGRKLWIDIPSRSKI